MGTTMEIRGKAAVITGAASGIGKAAAQELAKQGIKMLALVDLSDELTNVTNILRKEHPECNYLVGNVEGMPLERKTKGFEVPRAIRR